jgi:polyphosphate kinase 2 (PPK2 family)
MGDPKVSLKKLLKDGDFPSEDSKNFGEILEKLQLKLLRIQQGIWHNKSRVLVLFEGFDAAGKGGSIRRMVEKLDPRGVKVHAFGPPSPEEQGRHYLYRFWQALPAPGEWAVFDRSWYGRVLVEKVKKLATKERLAQAYEEINQAEKMLADDGIELIKIFLAISPEEQLKRFEARIKDPYKQWKITPEDIEARAHWDEYVQATEEMLEKTSTAASPWKLVPADHKHYARRKVLETAIERLQHHSEWMEKKALSQSAAELEKALKQVEAGRKK